MSMFIVYLCLISYIKDTYIICKLLFMNEKSAVHFGKCQLDVHYGNTGCQVFKGGTKLERFLPKN